MLANRPRHEAVFASAAGFCDKRDAARGCDDAEELVVELVSVVFSFRNEEENIEELITRTVAALDKANVRRELVFVNDCSDDRSSEILDRFTKQDKTIKILNMARRCGISPCALA